MTLLSASGLSVTRAGRRVLDAVAITVAAGECVGLIGPNGSGKTTLLRALVGLQPIAAGAVRFDGRPLAAMARRELARDLAYLPQGGDSAWAIPVRALVAMGRLPRREPWRGPRPADRAAVARALMAMDVTHLADRPSNQLSGGERARMLLARALAGEPRLLLADEPVAGLDPYHRMAVMESLLGLAEAGAGVIVVLHDLTLAARFCRRLVLLHHGRVVADGAPERVLSEDRLAEIYRVRAISHRRDGVLHVVPWDRLDTDPAP